MPRPRNTQARQQQIVESLKTCLSQESFQQLTIQSIGKQAKLTPGLLHYHFNTKMDILLALFDTLVLKQEDAYKSKIESLQASSSEHINPNDKLLAFIDVFLTLKHVLNADECKAWSSICHEAIYHSELGNKLKLFLHKRIEELEELLIAAALLNGNRLSQMRANKMAATAMAMQQGSIQIQALDEELILSDTVSGQIKAFFAIRLGMS